MNSFYATMCIAVSALPYSTSRKRKKSVISSRVNLKEKRALHAPTFRHRSAMNNPLEFVKISHPYARWHLKTILNSTWRKRNFFSYNYDVWESEKKTQKRSSPTGDWWRRTFWQKKWKKVSISGGTFELILT